MPQIEAVTLGVLHLGMILQNLRVYNWKVGKCRELSRMLDSAVTRHAGKLSEVIDSLPMRDGNIDVNALGMPLEEFVQREARRFSAPDELIDAFVNSRERAG